MTEDRITSKQAASGGAWTILSFGVASCVRLTSSLILTRILPDAASVYGTMALVFSFYGGIVLFSDFGIGLLLTQNPRGLEPAYRHTAFTAQVARGFLIWLVALPLAPLFSAAYPSYDGLQSLLLATALSAVIGGCVSTSIPAMQRRMQVGTIAKIEISSQVIATATTITHAYLSPSAWAIVSGVFTEVTVKALLSHLLNDTPDRLRWDKDAARQLRSVGLWVFVSTALTFCVDQADRLLFGQLISKEQLGVYAVAIVFIMSTRRLFHALCMNMLYPMLCQAERHGADMESVFVNFRQPITAGGGFVYTCMCGGGGAIMQLLYEGDFAQGGWMLQISACGAWFGSILGAPRGQVALARAQPKYVAIGNFSMVVAMTVLIPVGHALFAFPGAITGLTAANAVRYVVKAVFSKHLGVGRLRQDFALATQFSLGSATIMWMDHHLALMEVGPALRCLAVGALAAATWGPSAWIGIRDYKKARSKHEQSN